MSKGRPVGEVHYVPGDNYDAFFQTLARNTLGEAPEPESDLTDEQTEMLHGLLFAVAIWVSVWIANYDGPGHAADMRRIAVEWLREMHIEMADPPAFPGNGQEYWQPPQR